MAVNTEDLFAILRSELDNNLIDMMRDLIAFSEAPQEIELLQNYLKNCEQLTRVLHWLSFPFEAKVANELIQLGCLLLDCSIPYSRHKTEQQFSEILATLIKSIFRLQRYFHVIMITQKKASVLLIPVSNAMRILLAQPQLEESAYFSMECQIAHAPYPEFHPQVIYPSEQLMSAAKLLRRTYQASLLAVIQGNRVNEHLARLHQIIYKLYEWSAKTECAPSLRVALAAVEALQTQKILLTAERLVWLHVFDKWLKILVCEGEQAWQKIPSSTLMHQCLYLASLVHDERAKTLTQVRKDYQLAGYPLDQWIQVQRAMMKGPDQDVMLSLITELRVELNSVKKLLDELVSQFNLNKVQRLIDALQRLSSILHITGFVESAQLLTAKSTQVSKKLQDAAIVFFDWTELVDDLTYIDQAMIEGNHFYLDYFKTIPTGIKMTLQAAVEQAQGVVINEARAHLLLVQTSWEKYLITETSDANLLKEIAKILQTTSQVLYFMNLQRVAQTLHDWGCNIQKATFRDQAYCSDERKLSVFACVLMSIDFYLENWIKNQTISEQFLTIAEESICRLG